MSSHSDDDGGICQDDAWVARLWVTNAIGQFGARFSSRHSLELDVQLCRYAWLTANTLVPDPSIQLIHAALVSLIECTYICTQFFKHRVALMTPHSKFWGKGYATFRSPAPEYPCGSTIAVLTLVPTPLPCSVAGLVQRRSSRYYPCLRARTRRCVGGCMVPRPARRTSLSAGCKAAW